MFILSTYSPGLPEEIDDSQKATIDSQFRKYYLGLTGVKDYAISFMTAEWLYESLNGAGTIDLTSIALGYFKSVEQLLFKFISLHTYEKDQKKRTMLINGNKTLVTNTYLSENRDNITMANLTGFLRYEKNRELLREEINDETYLYIKQVLGEIKELRNGYLHKDNIVGEDAWEHITHIKDTAYLTVYLLLGAYQYSADDRLLMGIIEAAPLSDAEQLCRYIHGISIGETITEIPVFFINDNLKEPFFAHMDEKSEFDINGNIHHSGIYFITPGKINQKNCFLKLTNCLRK